MHGAIDLAVQRNVGYVYFTDDAILAAPNDNPFDRLPTYWQDEVNYVASFRARAIRGDAARQCGPRVIGVGSGILFLRMKASTIAQYPSLISTAKKLPKLPVFSRVFPLAWGRMKRTADLP